MKTIYLFLGISYICHLTKGCDLELAPVAVIVSGTAEFRFNPVPPGDSVTYLVLRGSEPPKLIVSYTFDTPDPVQVATGITFTGDEATGNISLRFANVQLSDNGTYDLKDSTPKILQCIVLHLLGKPTVSLSKDQDPKVGDSVEFTCDADSTTVPSPAPYGFIFSWTFGSVTDPTGARYTKVGNKFKISQVGKDDEGKTVTCKATENVTNGITSDPSSSVSFTVTGRTTTSTITTTITSSTTSMMTSSANATLTSSLRTSTTSISTSTTTTMVHTTVTSTKSTVKPTSIPRGTFTRTSPVTTTVPHVSDGDSDKAVVTMIIVVSVIGGILIVAIFSILFVMMHWKICFTRRGHSKQYAQRSDHRKQHRQAGYNASGRFFTNRQDHAMRGYYFYYGTYKNPLFYDPYENTSYVNNYYTNQKNSHDPKNMSSHKVYQNNYDRDYNWDLKDNY